MQTKEQAQHECEDEDDEHSDSQAPPLELPCAAGALDALCELDVGGLGVALDLAGLLFRGLHGGLLDDDGLGEVVEELVELDERLLDLLDVSVTGANGAEDGRSVAGAVGLELLF